jgi:hypothetical protein
MEIETKWSTVLVVMAIKIVVEEVIELISCQDVGARVNHSTPRQILVKLRIFPTIELVHYHFPYGVASCGAVLQVAVATVWHAEVHGVGPQRRVREGRRDGRVVQEGLFLHHGELVVTTNAQVRRADTYHAVVRKVGEFLDNDSCTSHFLGPVVNRGVTPELFVVVMPEVNKCLLLGSNSKPVVIYMQTCFHLEEKSTVLDLLNE